MILLSLSGCGLMNGYKTQRMETKLNYWKDKDINDVISAWGPPSSVYTMPNGNRMYSWNHSGPMEVQTDGYGYHVVSKEVVRNCVVRFVVTTSDIVRGWQWRGNAC